MSANPLQLNTGGMGRRMSRPPERVDFSKIKTAARIPNLIEIQRDSYNRFLQMDLLPEEREATGLQAVFRSVFPISDFRGTAELDFVEFHIGNWQCKCGRLEGLRYLRANCKECGALVKVDPLTPGETLCHKCGTFNAVRPELCPNCGEPVGLKHKHDQQECQERGMTYSVPLKVKIRLTVFDKDPEAIAAARTLADPRIAIHHDGFSRLGERPAGSAAGILMDLGISSPQIDNPARGFSFRADGPLDMRMDPTRGQSVAEWLAEAETDTITEVIREYGEERFAGQIAKAIDRRRQERGPIGTTAELAEVVAGAVKTREPGKDPATRTFQAFRIFINAELEELQQALVASLKVLQPGGRLVVISFHSLEDRIVKQFIAEHSREVFDRRAPFAPPKAMRLKALDRTKASADEVAANPRSRSAVMRVAERTEVPMAVATQRYPGDSA